jgi:hypothetical protein
VPRRAVPLVLIALAAALAAGCGGDAGETGGSRPGTATSPAPGTGGSGGSAPIGARARSCDAHAAGAEALRATGTPCEQARRVLRDWQRQPSCALAGGASRGACPIRSYRCQAVRGERGLAVSCARAGRSIAFIARRG